MSQPTPPATAPSPSDDVPYEVWQAFCSYEMAWDNLAVNEDDDEITRLAERLEAAEQSLLATITALAAERDAAQTEVRRMAVTIWAYRKEIYAAYGTGGEEPPEVVGDAEQWLLPADKDLIDDIPYGGDAIIRPWLTSGAPIAAPPDAATEGEEGVR